MLRSIGTAAVSQMPFHLSYLPFADPTRAPLHTYTTTTPQSKPQGASSSGRPPTSMLHSIGTAAVSAVAAVTPFRDSWGGGDISRLKDKRKKDKVGVAGFGGVGVSVL